MDCYFNVGKDTICLVLVLVSSSAAVLKDAHSLNCSAGSLEAEPGSILALEDDHDFPISRGGTNRIGNRRLINERVNRWKSSR